MPDPARDQQADELARLTQPCESTPDKGKAIVEDDADASGIINTEVNTVGSSSSSSQEMIKSLPSDDSSSLVDQLAPLTLNEERPPSAEAAIAQIADRLQIIVLAESDQPAAVGPGNSNIATSADSKKAKRKADQVIDEADAPPKVTRVMSETDAFWHNRELPSFRDSPDQASTSSGLGQYRCIYLMHLPEEAAHPADPTELQEQVYEPPRQLQTFQIPSFEIGSDRQFITPTLEEIQVEDGDEFLRRGHVMDED